MAEFKLPELGEGISSGTVTRILVNVGDHVKKDQPIIELETEKAVVEVPSSVEGTVKEMKVKEGDTVRVGQVLFVLSEEALAAPPAEAAQAEEVPARVEQPAPPPTPESPRAREEKPQVVEEEETEDELLAAVETKRPVRAAPSVRRMAQEMGVDLQQVEGSGLGGRVTPSDVRAVAERKGRPEPPAAAPAPAPAQPAQAAESKPGVETDHFGEIEREPMSGVRKKTAEHISTAWETIPHVTQFDSANITELEAFRKEYGKRVEASGGKLTMTVLIMKVVTQALKKFRQFNAVVDMENEQIIYKRYINIGVAVDTPHGLIVPVVHYADTKSLTALAVEVGQLAERARTRKVTIEDLQGGTFTVTNLGGIGGLWFTPIIKEPEVAILGVSRARIEPVWHEEDFEPRLMLPLSLSYDHRIIDGADAARFMRWMVEALQQPWLMMLD